MWLFGNRPLARCRYDRHELENLDPYFFFAKDLLPKSPVMLEIGSFTGANSRSFLERFGGSVIVYEAGLENFRQLRESVAGTAVITHNIALAGKDGEATFYEFSGKPSSNSVLQRRHKVERSYVVPTSSMESVLARDQLERIDVVLSNCEGAEVEILEELANSPAVWAQIGQICVSFHERIYGRRPVRRILKKFADIADIIEDTESRWPCHLFINNRQPLGRVL